MSNIICYDSDNNVLKTLYQWDNNQTMTVRGVDMPPVPVFHFCNRLSNLALVVSPTVSGTDLIVKIPNILLQQAEPIIAYLYQDTDDDGYRTMHAIHIPVIPRPKPDDYEYDDNIDYISVAILNSRLSELLSELTDGSSSDVAPEVIDIRIGYDGTVYDSAGDAVRALGEELTEMKAELEQYIDAKAVDGLYYEDNMLYLTSNGEIVSDPVEIVGGGGGGGGGSSSVVRLINNNDSTTFAVAKGETANLIFTFTSTEDDVPTGNGTCRVQVGGVTKSNFSIAQGQTTLNVADYLSVGANTVKITCTDIYGMYRSIVYTITVIELKITSTFDDTAFYNGDITFKYTPYGLIEKTVHILVDNVEIYNATTSASGKQSTKIISALSHGVHRLDAYLTATLDGSSISSEHLIFDIMSTVSGNTTPFIASPFTTTAATQGEQLSIPYTVYDPSALSCDITLTVYTLNSGSRVVYSTQSITVDRTRKTWNTRRYPTGTVYFEIAYPDGSISKTHSVTVSEASIDIQPVTNDLELALLSAGRSNSEANPASWTYENISTTFSGMNWRSTGWIEDENGDVALRLNGDATAVVGYKPFSTDLRLNGKTIEIEFAIREVNNRDAVVISCMNGGIGFKATADTAILSSEQSSVECRYKDEEKVRIAFVIESRNEYRMMSVYLNGVLSGAKQYPANDNFQQSSPVNITIGSQYCAVDVYTIRAYDTALSTMDVTNNYIADIADIADKIEVYDNNNIYDEYNNLSYEAIKPKIPVMTIVGALPQSKGDKKNVTIIYEDPFHPDLNFTDSCKIDVQGTSSQYYVRKNWKLKFSNQHQHAPGMMPAKTFCMKVDYAEGTGTHNTQNANLVDTLYSEQVPAQEDDERVRTAVYGFPCVIFSQADSTSEPVFYGKANFNYDKGAENVFGFTANYDVECWEFKNNTSDVCNFKSTMPTDWSEDFEARYPEDNTDISRLSALVAWVYNTRNDLTTFKSEFEDHFNLHYTLLYYVYTFLMLMVDQRAKNMMFTYWDETQQWYPYFYDNDTCLGINNEGQLVFDYYHEDVDQVDGANVYNGQNSILWNNIRLAFADEIKSLYQSLRNSGKITYDVLCNRFITKGSDVWSESIYNEDSDFKYVSMLRSEGDASNLYQIRGDGEQHFRYFIKNRLDYCDGKWYASDYANDYVSLRIYTPSGESLAVEPDADITVTPFSNMYAGVRYKANGTLQQTRATKNVAVTFEAPDETFNDTETAIYGASNLSSLGDLAPLYCGSINVSKATKLVTLKVGDSTTGYSNPNLTELSVGTNRLLKTLDVRNCPNLTDPLALANCPNIENIYAEGSGITGVELPASGYLKVIHLPETVRNLTLKNQLYITDFQIEDTDELKTIWIENCPGIDTKALIADCTALERLRVTNVNWSIADITFLQLLYDYGGLDETGANIDNAFVSGTCHVTALTGAEMAEINAAFPYLTITYDTLTSTLTYKSYDGSTTYQTQTITNGGDGSYTGSTPTKTSTAQYTFTFSGWSKTMGGDADANALKAVIQDRTVYAAFTSTIRKYTVTFKEGNNTLQTVQNVPYGGSATYTGTTPTKSGVSDPENYEFTGWSPSPSGITGDTTCQAQFAYAGAISDSWATISAHSLAGDAENYYAVGDCKEVALSGTVGTLSLNTTLFVYILGFDHNSTYEGNGITFGGFKNGAEPTAKNLCLIDSHYNTASTDGSKWFNMSHWSNINYGGWAGCDMRYDILGSTDVAPSGYGAAPTTSRVGYDATSTCATSPVANTLMSCLPSDLRAVMKPMTKYTDNASGGSHNAEANVTASIDYLPLLAEYEIFGARSYANEHEYKKQAQYAYYVAGNSKVKYQHSSTGSAAYWWERSPYYGYSGLFCLVGNGGNAYHGTAQIALGVAPAFLI